MLVRSAGSGSHTHDWFEHDAHFARRSSPAKGGVSRCATGSCSGRSWGHWTGTCTAASAGGIRLFAGQDLEPEFPSSRATESAPQPQEPPRLVVDVMRWMPKPSVRMALGIAAVAAGVALYRRGHGTPTSDRSAGDGHSRRSRLFGDAVASHMSRT